MATMSSASPALTVARSESRWDFSARMSESPSVDHAGGDPCHQPSPQSADDEDHFAVLADCSDVAEPPRGPPVSGHRFVLGSAAGGAPGGQDAENIAPSLPSATSRQRVFGAHRANQVVGVADKQKTGPAVVIREEVSPAVQAPLGSAMRPPMRSPLRCPLRSPPMRSPLRSPRAHVQPAVVRAPSVAAGEMAYARKKNFWERGGRPSVSTDRGEVAAFLTSAEADELIVAGESAAAVAELTVSPTAVEPSTDATTEAVGIDETEALVEVSATVPLTEEVQFRGFVSRSVSAAPPQAAPYEAVPTLTTAAAPKRLPPRPPRSMRNLEQSPGIESSLPTAAPCLMGLCEQWRQAEATQPLAGAISPPPAAVATTEAPTTDGAPATPPPACTADVTRSGVNRRLRAAALDANVANDAAIEELCEEIQWMFSMETLAALVEHDDSVMRDVVGFTRSCLQRDRQRQEDCRAAQAARDRATEQARQAAARAATETARAAEARAGEAAREADLRAVNTEARDLAAQVVRRTWALGLLAVALLVALVALFAGAYGARGLPLQASLPKSRNGEAAAATPLAVQALATEVSSLRSRNAELVELVEQGIVPLRAPVQCDEGDAAGVEVRSWLAGFAERSLAAQLERSGGEESLCRRLAANAVTAVIAAGAGDAAATELEL